MENENFLKTQIESLRQHLHHLIEKYENISEEDILYISKELDKILNEYNISIKKKIA